MKPSLLSLTLFVLLALAPLLLPFAAFYPNFSFVRRVELTLTYDGTAIQAEDRSFGVLGGQQVRRYGPVLEASSRFLDVVPAQRVPATGDVISVLTLRTPNAVYYPFASLRASRQPRAMRVISSDVAPAVADINAFLRHPSTEPLTLTRTQSYPLAFLFFDLIALGMLALIPRFWTYPLLHSVWLKLHGAPPEQVADPILKLFGRLASLAQRLER